MADPEYTVFIRVPIPRGDFVDPPPVNWDSSKDDALWKILSGAAQTDIDWNQVASRFDVPVDFLLQQVAYLTERHASQVRAQVRRATAAAKGSVAASPSPIPGSDSAGPGHARTASALSLRRDSPFPGRTDGSGSGTPLHGSTRPLMSRNVSTSTAVLREAGGSSPRPGKASAGTRTSDPTGRRRLSSLPITGTTTRPAEASTPRAQPDQDAEVEDPRSPSPGPAESNSTTSSDDESSPAQSRIIRRPPRYQDPGPADDDEEDDSEPAFQPYKDPASQASAQDLGSTLRGDTRHSQSRRAQKGHRTALKESTGQSQTSDSSNSSAANPPRPTRSHERRTPGPLSPQGTADRSGRGSEKSRSYNREGSDGTPSMGSSFSDLDDASVTQSALEEALASHMNQRGASSRFSISQAFRSRYTPGNKQ